MSNEPTRLGPVIGAYLGTHMADMPRAAKHGKAVQVSAAEVDLAMALTKAGIGDWEQQVKIGPYYVDFLFDRCFVVEVDGVAFHADPERERQRDEYLRSQGVQRIWHFPAAEVFMAPEFCVQKIVGQRRRMRMATGPKLPVTERFYPRPVMARLTAYWAGSQLAPPTEAEKIDAIKVLREGPLAAGPCDDPMYAMAERIFIEAGV